MTHPIKNEKDFNLYMRYANQSRFITTNLKKNRILLMTEPTIELLNSITTNGIKRQLKRRIDCIDFLQSENANSFYPLFSLDGAKNYVNSDCVNLNDNNFLGFFTDFEIVEEYGLRKVYATFIHGNHVDIDLEEFDDLYNVYPACIIEVDSTGYYRYDHLKSFFFETRFKTFEEYLKS